MCLPVLERQMGNDLAQGEGPRGDPRVRRHVLVAIEDPLNCSLRFSMARNCG